MRHFLLLSFELSLIAAATILAVVIRDSFEIPAGRLHDLSPYLLFTLCIAIAAIPLLRVNRNIWRYSAMGDYFRILAATVTIVSGALALSFAFNRMEGLPRALPILQALLILFVLVGVRIIMRVWCTVEEQGGSFAALQETEAHDTVLVAGLGRLTNLYLEVSAQFARDHIRIAGLLADNPRDVGQAVCGHQVLGTSEEAATVIRHLEIHGVFVDRIVVATGFQKLSPQVQDALLEIEKAANIKVEFLLEQLGLTRRTRKVEGTGAPPGDRVFAIDAKEMALLRGRPYWRIRRVVDLVGAVTLLIALSPLMLIVAVLVATDVGLPVIFWQQRPGLDGRPFKLYKFRTMAAAHDGNGERVPDEERTSALGQFLRFTRLDEMPQLLNILAGEMSFIGPRPLLPIDQPAACAARLLIRPGLTGWAQVMGGRDICPADKAALDVCYVRNASLTLDLQILWRTIWMVIFGERTNDAAIRRAWDELRGARPCVSTSPRVKQASMVALAAKSGNEGGH